MCIDIIDIKHLYTHKQVTLLWFYDKKKSVDSCVKSSSCQ